MTAKTRDSDPPSIPLRDDVSLAPLRGDPEASGPVGSLHDAAWPDMFANLQVAYSELTHTQSEMERRSAQIDELRDLFEQVIESMSDALFLMDGGGRISRVNRAARELLERQDSQLVGVPFGQAVPGSDIPATPAEVVKQAASGELTHLETRIVTASQRTVPVGVSCSLVRDKRGKITGVVVIARDITDQKKVQEAEKELAQMKEDFVASVSHELRTPLASIKGFADLLLKNKVGDESVRQEFLSRMIYESDRLMALVNDLLDISRMEAGRLQLDLSSFDLDELISATLKALHGVADQRKIPLGYDEGSAAFTLEADRRRLQQVLVNLIGNAIKFSEPFHGVQVRATVDGKIATIEIEDHGPGIPPEALPKLFDKFYQSSSQRAASGTGLGLYISKQVIAAHGGEIMVRSTFGKGSTFTIALPLVVRSEEEQ